MTLSRLFRWATARRWKLDDRDRLRVLMEAGPLADPFLSVVANVYYSKWAAGHPDQLVVDEVEYEQLFGMAMVVSHVLGRG
jgi:hypothetical protein